MREPFPHDIRAVFAAPGKALSLKKIFVSSLYLLAAYIVYAVFTYIALLYDGVSFEYIWGSYGMFPVRLFPFDSSIAGAIHFAGVGLSLFCLSLGILAGAVINFEELRGDHFFSAGAAVRFSLRRLPTMLLAFISIAAFVAFIYLLGLIAGLIGRVPVVGELLIGVFYIIPIFITLILTVFIVFVAALAVLVLPVVMAAQKEREVFDSLLQLFSVIIKEPIRFFWYLAVTSVLAKVASFVMAYFFYRTIQLSKLLLSTGGGEKIERQFNAAVAMLPMDSPVVTFVANIFPGIPFGFSLDRWPYGGHSAGAVVLAVSFFLLFVIILGYMTAVMSTGLARGYAVIRRMKDDYLIVEEPPLSACDDYANPPFDTDENTL